MNELYFLGMDIVGETKNIISLSEVVCTYEMTENERKAYQMGIANTISALEAVIRENDIPVVDISGMEIPTELSVDDMENYYSNLY